MTLHRNAKTTPKMRQLLIDRVTCHGWTQRKAADAAGVGVRTVANEMDRAVPPGDRALGDRSSQPRRQPRTLCPVQTAAILAYRHTPATA